MISKPDFTSPSHEVSPNLIHDTSSLLFVLGCALLIACGQIFDTLLILPIFRGIITLLAILLTIRNGTAAIIFTCLGYFVPLILGAANTLLPQTYLFYFLLLLFAFILNMDILQGRRRINSSNFNFWTYLIFIFFLILVIQSDVFSRSPGLHIESLLIYTTGLLAVTLIKTHNDLHKILFTIIVISTFFSIWTIFGPSNFNDSSSRFEIGFDQNFFSLFIGFGLFPLTGIILSTPFKANVMTIFLTWALGIFHVIALLWLGSRGIFIALFIAIITMFGMGMTSKLKAMVTTGFMLLSFWGLTFLPGTDVLFARFQEREALGNLSFRLPLAMAAINHMGNAPFNELLFGAGTDAGADTLGGLISNAPTSPHNQFLEFGLDYGVVGLFLFLLLFYLGLRYSLRSMVGHRQIRIGLLVFLFISCLTLTPFKLSVLPWIVLGVCLPRLETHASAHT